MATEFTLPDLGENIASGDVVTVFVSEGDVIKPGQALLEVETDKAVIEVPCPPGGRIDKVLVKKGDTVKVGVRISEGNKERIQPYEGVVIAKRHGGMHQTITVRRIFQGIGVERVFMLHSPQVATINVERRGKVRRAKLFYLRDRVGKATRVKQRFDR